MARVGGSSPRPSETLGRSRLTWHFTAKPALRMSSAVFSNAKSTAHEDLHAAKKRKEPPRAFVNGCETITCSQTFTIPARRVVSDLIAGPKRNWIQTTKEIATKIYP